jgi:hypothetical protein
MKKLILPSAILVLLASACETGPDAGFYADRQVADVYENIYFTNTSNNADYYKWYFGDGTESVTPYPVHYYNAPGRYLVTLEAYRGTDKVDAASMYIDVVTTTLDIEVLEYYDHYPVPEASIVLYTTQEDWDQQTNTVFGSEWFTDANGIAIIHGLDPIVYYVDIWHPNHNNYTLAYEDINFVKTPPLIRNEVNQFTFYVDYVGTTMDRKEGREVARYKVVKIERKSTGVQAR